ncbi:MAG: alpha/beta hydrolase [Anaerolineae bacterium]|nr:alpha/beta hydrolase [Anaerolineae bacterium]
MNASLPMESDIERPGCILHYWLTGPEDRPLVALLHGATMDHHMFDAQLSALAAHYRVLAWDARGHGCSRPTAGDFTLADCADDLIAILDQLGVQKVILVGQSMGGYIAQFVYLRHPQRVQAMVIVGATCIALPYSRWEILALRWTLPLFRWWPYDHLARLTARSIALKPDVQAYALATLRQLEPREFLRIWKAITPAISRKGIPGHVIGVPLLLTHGDQDRTGSIQRQAPTWAAYEPDVDYKVIPNASHNANQDQPTFFNEILLSFLGRHTH